MTEIYVKGSAQHMDSPVTRHKTIRGLFQHMPAFQCQRYQVDGTFQDLTYWCGKCFSKQRAGAITSLGEIWVPGSDAKGNLLFDVVPKNARCEGCGGHAWPMD